MHDFIQANHTGTHTPSDKDILKGKVHFKTFFADSDAEYVIVT